MKIIDLIIIIGLCGIIFLIIVIPIVRTIHKKLNPISDWLEAEARMTGRTRRVIRGIHQGMRMEYTEYEMEYEANGQSYQKWFDLYPGPDLGDIYDMGTIVKIRYSYADPDEFEVLEIVEERWLTNGESVDYRR